ncbi:hypothetical protein DASC09_014650 [Saccharomycopsis crataegensis]|uniref:Phosphatidylinositol-specific phospholipase C X domain-containing protein n=1 Tax=Saccharomycopsis crataegensis TaxID=43959 RepID=A0AAV5QI24_9ASCO|nr:hypothetical protein DASC09_014650 [Saccharomycopsis crataegensis]
MVNLASIDDLVEWQKRVDDNTKLSKLAIPGTHNSEAYHTSLPSVQCQDASVTQQLEHGIRFLDIRSGRKPLSKVVSTITATITGSPNNSSSRDVSELYVVHGTFPVKLPNTTNLDKVLNEVYDFLSRHPSECVMISIKQEGEGSWDGDDFPNLLWKKYVEPHQDKYYLNTDIPRLGDVRGKIFLFRRFGVQNSDLNGHFGFDAHFWNDNTTSDDRGSFSVQDFYDVKQATDIEAKAKYVKEQAQRASDYCRDHDDKLFVNFCSASNFFDTACWPEKITEGLTKYGLVDSFGKGCGVVVIDYASKDDWNIPRALVAQNF